MGAMAHQEYAKVEQSLFRRATRRVENEVGAVLPPHRSAPINEVALLRLDADVESVRLGAGTGMAVSG